LQDRASIQKEWNWDKGRVISVLKKQRAKLSEKANLIYL